MVFHGLTLAVEGVVGCSLETAAGGLRCVAPGYELCAERWSARGALNGAETEHRVFWWRIVCQWL